MDFRLVWSDQLSNLVILVYNLEKLVFFKTLRFYMKPFILSHFQSKVEIKLLISLSSFRKSSKGFTFEQIREHFTEPRDLLLGPI